MNKFQNVSFKDVEEFLEYLPEEEHKIVLYLRSLIFACIPHIKEKLAYNIPFYYQNKRVCYIWPSAVPWGKVKETGAVVLGFCQGQKLLDEAGILDKDGRKEIATVSFLSIKEIDSELIRSYIYEAIYIDEQTI